MAGERAGAARGPTRSATPCERRDLPTSPCPDDPEPIRTSALCLRLPGGAAGAGAPPAATVGQREGSV